MGHSHRTGTLALGLGLAGLACLVVSCTDPVKDRAIERLGGEDPNVPMGPEHRPGQPCVLCHSEGGPAAAKPFAIAGTIFETNAPDSKGAEGVQVFFIDAAAGTRNYETNAAGNFFIPQSEWNDLTFPFKTGILKGDKKGTMISTVNREGSCNFCHKPNKGSPLSLPGDDPRESIGQIFLVSVAGAMGGSQ